MSDNTIFGIAPMGPNAEQDYQREANLARSFEAAKLFGPAAFFGQGAVGAAAPAPIPFEVQARMTAQQQAQKRFSELDPTAMENLDSGAKSRIYRRFLAEEAFRSGLPDVGSQLFSQVSEEHEASLKRSADLEKIGVESNKAAIEAEAKQFDLTRGRLEAVRGKMATIWRANSTNPNSGVNAFIDDNGNALVDGKVFAPAGTFSTVQPRTPRANGSGGGYGKARDHYTPTEQRGLRGSQRDVLAQMRAATRIHEIMQTAFKQGGSIDILGKAGGASAVVTKIIDEVSAMGRAIKKAGGDFTNTVTVDDGSGNVLYKLDGSQRSAETLADSMSDVEFNIPKSIRNDETQTRRYKAAMINLAYAIARAEEPGNPRLSDDDFKRNLAQISESTTSPETLRQVILDRINTSVADFDIMKKQILPQFQDEIFTEEANKVYSDQYTQFMDIYSKPFGTAGAPGTGITGPKSGATQRGSRDLGDGASVTFN